MNRLILMILLSFFALAAHAVPSDSERIAALEQQVARLTEQVNRLLAERLDHSEKHQNQAVYVCEIKAFTSTYSAEHSSRGRARLDALRQCRRDNSDMFCREESVQCKMYP